MPPTLTQAPQLESIIQKANDRAKKFNRPQNVVDLLIEIVGLEKYRRLFQAFNLNPDGVVESLSKLPEVVPGCVETATAKKEYAQILKYSKESAKDLKFGFVDVEHIFHQLLNSSVTIRAWAQIAELPIDAIIERMQPWLTLEGQRGEELSNEMLQPDFPTIEQYCINLNEKVANDDSFCYGREKEINQILDIICRQKKSNVLLIGEPGVGRKTIVQGAIEKILSGGASEILKGKEFFLVEISKMMAGTAMFGSLESRFVNLIKEAEQHGQCVLVIDNLNQAFDGETKGSKSDIANLLRPILDKPGVSVIGICTQGEYKKVEKESALSRFEVIKVSEPSKEETRAILINSISELEYYHHVDLPVSTIDTILDLCEKFIPYKKFPEKAFDFLDHLGARAKNKHFVRPESLTKLENKLAETFDPTAEKDSPLYKKMESLIERYGKAFNKWMNRVDTTVPVISAQEAVSTFAEKHGIPENQIKQLQNSNSETIRERIKEQVFGQDHAIDKVMDVLLCSKVGLREKNKPLAKFLFIGSTGTGKTEIGKQLALSFFGDEKNLLKLDMSEFQERGSASSMIGTSAGYIGYGDGGRLTEFVKHNANCVVLFDEVEKAHPDILNLMLQIMDDGYITDGQGYRVDFTNTIIIATSNIGAGAPKSSVGFIDSKKDGQGFLDAVKKEFKPEWLARLDEIVVFNSMTDDMLQKILNKYLSSTIQKLASDILVTIDDSVKVSLLKKLKEEDSHARNVQATIRREIEVPLAKYIIQNRPKQITVTFDAENKQIRLV